MRRREGDTGKLTMDSLSYASMTGDCIGESGRGSFSGVTGSSSSGKGPSRGFAGDTGRLPGMASSLFLPSVGRVTNGFVNPSSTAEVSQLSNPSPRQEISSESVSRGGKAARVAWGGTMCEHQLRPRSDRSDHLLD